MWNIFDVYSPKALLNVFPSSIPHTEDWDHINAKFIGLKTLTILTAYCIVSHQNYCIIQVCYKYSSGTIISLCCVQRVDVEVEIDWPPRHCAMLSWNSVGLPQACVRILWTMQIPISAVWNHSRTISWPFFINHQFTPPKTAINNFLLVSIC